MNGKPFSFACFLTPYIAHLAMLVKYTDTLFIISIFAPLCRPLPPFRREMDPNLDDEGNHNSIVFGLICACIAHHLNMSRMITGNASCNTVESTHGREKDIVYSLKPHDASSSPHDFPSPPFLTLFTATETIHLV